MRDHRTHLLLLALAMLPSCLFANKRVGGYSYMVPLNGELVHYEWNPHRGAMCIADSGRRCLGGSHTVSGYPTRRGRVDYHLWTRNGIEQPCSWALLTGARQVLILGGKLYDLASGRLFVIGPPEGPFRCTQLNVDVPAGMTLNQLRLWVVEHDSLIRTTRDGPASVTQGPPLDARDQGAAMPGVTSFSDSRQALFGE